MPEWPMAMPSSTAIVLNSFATAPAASISRATNCPRSFRWTWPGTNWVKELAIAMMGLPKSPSFMPVARHRPRAPAMLRPWVVVRERYAGMSAGPSVAAWRPRCSRAERPIPATGYGYAPPISPDAPDQPRDIGCHVLLPFGIAIRPSGGPLGVDPSTGAGDPGEETTT